MASIARNENESFEDYKNRRASINEVERLANRPKVFWDSYSQGTYINPNKKVK